MGRAARTALPTDQGLEGPPRSGGTLCGGAAASSCADRRWYGSGVCGNDRRYREIIRIAHRMSREECGAAHIASFNAQRNSGDGPGDRGAVHGSPPMDRTRLTPVGYGAAPSPAAAEHTKPPTAFTCSSGGHRMRTRRRTAFRVRRNGARPFTSGRNPVVTSCDGPHTLRWGQLRMQQVGERCCVSMCPGWTFRGCGWPRGRTHCGKPFSVFTGSGTGVLRRCSGNGVRNPGRG